MGLSIDEYDKTEESSAIPPMPPFEEIVELLYDKELCFPDEITVARVIYSKDKSKRFTILKNGKGLYINRYEEIWTYFEEEWVHMYNGWCTCPGWWQDEVYVIPFSQITSVTVGSRYSRFFAKYV